MSEKLRDTASRCVMIFRLKATVAKRDGDEDALWDAREARFRWTQIFEFAGVGYLTPRAVETMLIVAESIISEWDSLD